MSPLGYTWDVDGTLMKPPTVLSDMYLLKGSVTKIDIGDKQPPFRLLYNLLENKLAVLH